MKPDLNKPWCYFVPQEQDTARYGGFVPSLVVEGEQGHYPMTGSTGREAPWVWGDTYEKAVATCEAVNAERGITKERAEEILRSSIIHPFKERKHARRNTRQSTR
jgi:hypothetical protein